MFRLSKPSSFVRANPECTVVTEKKKGGEGGFSAFPLCKLQYVFVRAISSPPTLIHLFIASVALLGNSDILLQPGGGDVARSWNHCDY